jgi:hypothetical protein
MDAYSEVFLGYHISEGRLRGGYWAFKMAIQASEHRLTKYHWRVPVTRSFHSGGFFDKISHLAIKTQPYNGKSKTIESAFGRL